MSRLIYMIAFVFTLITPAVVRAQYYSVNVDYQTIAAMSESFATEASMEALHNENLQNIYDSYKAAEVASAGIFASKYLDRKALTDLNLWNSEQENKYYTRIYNIVSQRIIPKLIEDAQKPTNRLVLGKLSREDMRRHQEPVHAVREHRDQQHAQFQGYCFRTDCR